MSGKKEKKNIMNQEMPKCLIIFHLPFLIVLFLITCVDLEPGLFNFRIGHTRSFLTLCAIGWGGEREETLGIIMSLGFPVKMCSCRVA